MYGGRVGGWGGGSIPYTRWILECRGKKTGLDLTQTDGRMERAGGRGGGGCQTVDSPFSSLTGAAGT